ncbi:tRNA (5-methylaminomethyl-2-thiouridine)(34)-methyltransferase MnmD [Pontimicrobium aquaticum]|uniref:SAM-dependent methyltransferase n=1 Tax=Pontimicrobium aquaticum TaxID=2565367 RepID=A0A4U0EYY2_9FLAO|nr:tRNA (5-methylaminomethyl-2-thiouridine)(34)-methyltransferase MnmD [Pontimicrobium aquaticum]TJY37311.1 SAM-dependent methyltransferase [Pontimicrobium aquaticum]
MKRKIITTSDGSKTIQIEDWNEQYHSKHGAINEANHVFIKSGLLHFFQLYPKVTNLSILEIGFGTGLNAFLTVIQAERLNIHIDYLGVEAYPVADTEILQLNYVQEIDKSKSDLFAKLHAVDWEVPSAITNTFRLTKRQQFFSDINDVEQFDLIYFDAFGARVQPELWTKAMFQKMYNALKPKGVLVTYASIGQVKRDMKKLGFTVERLDGPPGKRHMLRATK